MTVALLYGAGSGALHAVTGPDHVLCLSPAALERPKASWRIGVTWGVGHALGTLLLAVPLLALAHVVHVPALAAWGEHLAGAALLATALMTLRSLGTQAARGRAAGSLRSPLIAKLGDRLDARAVTRGQRVLATAALALGVYWLVP